MRRLYLDLGVYVFIMVCGAVVIGAVSNLPEPMAGDLGSAFFPRALSYIMIALCGLGMIGTLAARNDERVVFGGGVKLIVTIGALAVFFSLWSAFGYFYLFAYLFLFGLLTYYASDERLSARLVILTAVGSAVFIGLAYLFFTEVLYTRF